MKIFISHSSKDKWAARRIGKELEDIGASIFLDEKDIETGQPIDDAIHDSLKNCDEILILLSPASIKSHWVLIEVGGAKVLDKRLIPILLYLGANEIPSPISKHLARDINSIEKYYDELKARIKSGNISPPPKIQNRVIPLKITSKKTFKVGDVVRIPYAPQLDAERGDFVSITWDRGMNQYCGMKATVSMVDNDRSVRLDVDGTENWWAFEWLEKII